MSYVGASNDNQLIKEYVGKAVKTLEQADSIHEIALISLNTLTNDLTSRVSTLEQTMEDKAQTTYVDDRDDALSDRIETLEVINPTKATITYVNQKYDTLPIVNTLSLSFTQTLVDNNGDPDGTIDVTMKRVGYLVYFEWSDIQIALSKPAFSLAFLMPIVVTEDWQHWSNINPSTYIIPSSAGLATLNIGGRAIELKPLTGSWITSFTFPGSSIVYRVPEPTP